MDARPLPSERGGVSRDLAAVRVAVLQGDRWKVSGCRDEWVRVFSVPDACIAWMKSELVFFKQTGDKERARNTQDAIDLILKQFGRKQ